MLKKSGGGGLGPVGMGARGWGLVEGEGLVGSNVGITGRCGL